MTTFLSMWKRGYRKFPCPACGKQMWIHHDDGNDTEVRCFRCGYRGLAGAVRNPESEKDGDD